MRERFLKHWWVSSYIFWETQEAQTRLLIQEAQNLQHEKDSPTDDAIVQIVLRKELKIAASNYLIRVHLLNPKAHKEQWEWSRTPPLENNHQANEKAYS